jgi:hypothetical protein
MVQLPQHGDDHEYPLDYFTAIMQLAADVYKRCWADIKTRWTTHIDVDSVILQVRVRFAADRASPETFKSGALMGQMVDAGFMGQGRYGMTAISALHDTENPTDLRVLWVELYEISPVGRSG